MDKCRWKGFYRKFFFFLAVGLTSLLMLALLLLPVEAQGVYGTILGVVTDPSGSVVVGATVTLTNIGTGEKHSGQTDAAGNYHFLNLMPANYRLEVENAGFKRLTREPITLQVGGELRIDATLEVGGASETIEVSSSTPLLQTESGTVSSVVEGTQVQEMPLNGRNAMNLIALAPGVVPHNSAMGSTGMNASNHTDQSGWGSYQIGGALSAESATYIDGAPINVLAGNDVGIVPTQDALQEFRVAINPVSPEFGRFGGGGGRNEHQKRF